MLDIKVIKENPQFVKERLLTRNKDYSADIDRLLELDKSRRALIADTEQLKAKQNAVSKQIPQMKKEGKDTAAIFEEMRQIADKTKADTDTINSIDTEMETILLSIPNLPNADCPVGRDDTENREIRRWGEPRTFDFEAQGTLGHRRKDLGHSRPRDRRKGGGRPLPLLSAASAPVSKEPFGHRLLSGHPRRAAAMTEIIPPYHRQPRLHDAAPVSCPSSKRTPSVVRHERFFLIPTAEVPVTNMHRNDDSPAEELPIKYCAYSACFRAEAGVPAATPEV